MTRPARDILNSFVARFDFTPPAYDWNEGVRHWQNIADPNPLESRKEAAERHAARAGSAKISASDTDALVQQVRSEVSRFKRLYADRRDADMLELSKKMRAPVRALRVELRRKGATENLPPRASQFTGRGAHALDEALAWVSNLERLLAGNDKNTGALLSTWRQAAVPHAVPQFFESRETGQVVHAKRLGLSDAVARRDNLVAQLRDYLDHGAPAIELIVEEKVVGPLRVALLAMPEPQDLPSRWYEYTYAGGFADDNRQHWRFALSAWLQDYDRVPMYAASASPLHLPPPYSAPPYSPRPKTKRSTSSYLKQLLSPASGSSRGPCEGPRMS